MKKTIAPFIIILLAISCSQNKKSNTATITSDAKTSADSIFFFPVTSFLQGQMKLLDSMPVTILQVTTKDGRQDSAWVPVAQARHRLQVFLQVVIDKKNLTPFFKETKFNDQSTESITFMYGPKAALPDSMALRRWDVYVDPDKGTVKRVFIIRQAKENNAAVTQQLTWQTGKWAKIVTIKNEPCAKPDEIKWVWDLTEAFRKE